MVLATLQYVDYKHLRSRKSSKQSSNLTVGAIEKSKDRAHLNKDLYSYHEDSDHENPLLSENSFSIHQSESNLNQLSQQQQPPPYPTSMKK